MACDPSDAPLTPGDARDDDFASGKADTAGIGEGSPDAIAVLVLVNEADGEELLDAAELGSMSTGKRAVDNILAYRLGDDGEAGTGDDEVFDTLAELDAIPYVGPKAFERLLDYAIEHLPPVDGAIYVPALPSGVLDLRASSNLMFVEGRTSQFGGGTQKVLKTLRVDVDGSNPGEATVTMSFGDSFPKFEIDAQAIPSDGLVTIDEAWQPAPVKLGHTDCIVLSASTCAWWHVEEHELHAVIELRAGGVVEVHDFSYGVRIHPRETSVGFGGTHDFPTKSSFTYTPAEPLLLTLSSAP